MLGGELWEDEFSSLFELGKCYILVDSWELRKAWLYDETSSGNVGTGQGEVFC